ncbi:MAG: TadE family protein [Actinomycetota bacterium]
MRFRSERGTAALELAIVAPVLMVLVLGIVQFGLWYHAEHVARTAAVEAARLAAAEDGTESGAEARASDVLSAGLGHAAEEPAVDVTIGSDTVRAQVTARLRGLLPIPGFSSFVLRGDATAYRERFRPAGEGP